ncbi:MAG: dockerin type I repeat-containing protein [Clostridia bacterium]|nr:dockerin type I repeat-containing protein [Clostridia bacterium]
MTKKLLSIVLTATLLLSAALPAIVYAAPVLRGDVDGDGKISSADARLALRGSVGLETLTADFITRADVDKNGKVESSDARTILRAAVNLETIAQDDHEHTVDKWEPVAQKDGSHTTYHTGVCTICGAAVFGDHDDAISVIQHNTCTQPGLAVQKCSFCGLEGDTVVIPAGHEWEEVEGTKTEATCTEDGVVDMKCALCGETKTEVLPKGHLPGLDATCTQPQTCKRCGEVLSPALGHLYKDTASVTITTGIRCDRCGETAVPCFNDLVNVLKNGTHTYTGFKVSTSSASEPQLSGIMETLINLMISTKQITKEEVAAMLSTSITDETYYSVLTENRDITKYSFNVSGSDKVSELTDADVQSITTERVKGIDFLASLPDTYINEWGMEENLTAIKNTVIGDVIKVTVVLAPEQYSELQANGAESAIGKIDSDVAGAVAGFMGEGQNINWSEELGDAGGDDDLGTVLSNAMRLKMDTIADDTVTYYFDAVTNAPICAHYDGSMLVKFAMDLYLNDDLSASDKSTGSIKIDSTTDMDFYCFFDGYFPA